MATKVARSFSVKSDASIFKRLGRGNQQHIVRNHQVQTRVCKYWLQGRCNRNPCRFFHPDSSNHHAVKSKHTWNKNDTLKSGSSSPKEKAAQPSVPKDKVDCGQNLKSLKTREKPLENEESVCESIIIQKEQKLCNYQLNESCKKGEELQNFKSFNTQENLLENEESVGESEIIQKKQKLCNYWLNENCKKGEECESLHSWFCGNGLSLVTQLEGPTKAVTGIVYTPEFNTLSCGSRDKSFRAWDCSSGQCKTHIDTDDEFGTLVNEGPWVFAGLTNMIKAWNFETQNEIVIRGSGGQVNAITMFEDILFAGMEDGTILAWKSTSKFTFCETPMTLKGHSGSVLSLVIGAKKLFSGSADHTIRVWDPESLEGMHVLTGHTGHVTSVLCWDEYLLSGSLDKKIKVWATSESGNIEEVYEHEVYNGVIALCGMCDAEAKPILLCSSKDNGVGLYDLPSFVERGRVFSRRDIQVIQIGPEGMFFTGDEAGLVSVWKLIGNPTSKSC